MQTAETLAICVRGPRNGLIAAECLSLTGGRPDVDGVATAGSVERIERAAFVRHGAQMIARASSLDALAEQVAAATFPADGFRIDVHDPSDRLDRSAQQVAVLLADAMPYYPNLRDPQHRFVVVLRDDEFWFGEVVVESDASYRTHDAKPWTTSSSLDSRFSRALVNLVPDAASILDPCCGAGSIVLEAASLGLDASGIDWKPAMVGMTEKNAAHFGYDVHVERADSRSIETHADAIVTDLPYGHALDTDEATVRSIIERCAGLAPQAVYVAPTDITEWISTAGYGDVVVHTVEKRRGFTRWIHVATR